MGMLDGFFSLAARINKVETDEQERSEGDIGELADELTVQISDEDLIKMSKDWLREWGGKEKDITQRQNKNRNYWLGVHFDDQVQQVNNVVVDNRIFVDVESLIPLVAGQNPEPLVSADNTAGGMGLALKVAKHLQYQADIQKLKLMIQTSARYWMLDLMSVVKFSWDLVEDDIKSEVISARKLILDPDATISVDGYTGDYIGEYKEMRADKLVEAFPEMEKFIKEKVKNKMWTKVKFIEWWTDEVLFWTFQEQVLGKTNNPHWNYGDREIQARVDAATGQAMVDEFTGEEVRDIITTPGKNHFSAPRKPYVFLGGIYNLGKHPHDDTSLIEQTINQQDLINKRQKQIDKNADQTNGGLVLDSNFFNKDEAAGAAAALRKGGAILAPGGPSSVQRVTGPPLPGFVIDTLFDYRNEIDNIFGIHATTKGEKPQTKTLGGQILLEQADKTRASTITGFIEQYADDIYNWWTQLFYVYYDESHTAAVLGEENKDEFVELINDELLGKLVVSVKEGSMIPIDPMTKRAEAIDLWQAGAIDPITLFTALDNPDPRAAAEKLIKFQVDPSSLLQEGEGAALPPEVGEAPPVSELPPAEEAPPQPLI